MTTTRTIKLKKYQDIILEQVAAGTIKPGSQLALTADGTVQVNGTAGGPAPSMFALEDELQGRTTRDDYSAEDPVQVWYAQPGEEVLALVASAFDPNVGDLLEASTAGRLQAHDAGVAQFQVIGDKVVDADDNHRVPVRVL